MVLIGIIVIPGIYAWLNIDSNWGPYDNTGNIPIAVVNKDQGAMAVGESFNIGNSLVESLESNDDMKWTFTDEQSAIDGVNASDYYGAIIIPEDFSQSLTTILSSTEPTKPTFDFYINEKKNPIAPIITSKAAGAIRDEANRAFVDTLVYKAADTAKTIGLVEKGNDTADTLTAKLADTKARVGQLREVNKAATLAIDTTGKSLQALEAVIPTLESFNSAAGQRIDDAKNSLNSLGDAGNLSSVQELSDQISGQIAELETIQSSLEAIAPSSEQLDQIKARIAATIDTFNTVHSEFQAAAGAELGQIYQDASRTLDSAGQIVSGLDSSLDRCRCNTPCRHLVAGWS